MRQISFISLFPQVFANYIEVGMLAKAQQKGIVNFNLVDLRQFGQGPRLQVDDTPYGGGAGMILKIEPLVTAIESINNWQKAKVILLTPQGQLFEQTKAEQLAQLSCDLIFIGGRYEGYDERLIHWVDEQICIGQYILTGFELPALVVADAVVRLMDNVLSCHFKSQTESFSQGKEYLKYPQYTKPAVFRHLAVPKILLSGNHQEISQWRNSQVKKKK